MMRNEMVALYPCAKANEEFRYAPYLVSKQKCFTSRNLVAVHKITINFV